MKSNQKKKNKGRGYRALIFLYWRTRAARGFGKSPNKFGRTWTVFEKKIAQITSNPRRCHSSPEDIVIKVAQLIGVKLDNDTIEISYRMNRKTGSPFSWSSWVTRIKPDHNYRPKTKLKKVTITDIFPKRTIEPQVTNVFT